MAQKDKYQLFGIEVKVDHSSYIYYKNDLMMHIFYCPIQSSCSHIWIHIWAVDYFQNILYYFSAFHNGLHINPIKDSRFANVITQYFPKFIPWTECYFNNMRDLINFIHECDI